MENITLYTIAYDGYDFVELDDLVSDFDKIHMDRNRPVGDDLDQQINSMFFELALKHNAIYMDAGNNSYIFYPNTMSESEVMDAWEASLNNE